MQLFLKIFKYRKNQSYLLLLLISILLSVLLVFSGNFSGHDLEFHISRIEGIYNGLKNGVFPVRIYPEHIYGYGYANGIFYPDLFLYIPALLRLLGINMMASINILIAIVTFFTMVTMYICVKRLSNSNDISLCASILYTTSSYRLADIFPRFALGELVSFVFLPLVILGVYEIVYGNYKKWYIISIGFLGLLFSHMITFVLALMITFIVFLCVLKKFIKEPKRFQYLFIAILVSCGISLWFIVPMVEQLIGGEFVLNNVTTTTDLFGNALNPLQLFIIDILPNSLLPSWITVDKSLNLGIIFVFLIILRIYIFINKNKYEKYPKYADIFLILGIISAVLSTKLFPWWIAPSLLRCIQFPWRMIVFSSIFLSISGAITIFEFSKFKKASKYIVISIVMLSLVLAIPTFLRAKANNITGLSTTSISFGEYLPMGTDIAALETRGQVITSNDETFVVSNIDKMGSTMSFDFISENKNLYIDLPLLYYKGYSAVLTDDSGEEKYVKISVGENNIVRLNIKDSNKGSISVKYTGTVITRVCDKVSLIFSICLAIFLIIKNIRKRR